MGTIRWEKSKIELLPIKVPNEDEEIEIVNIVDKILSLKSLDPIADTTSLEAEIDRMVYDLYGLTEEERKIVEGE
ncbi:MAG: class I SAM-dependent DNA methyltransferase [Saprospiraceae bacterium]|nr:class I SAM-dependent DNA methyltransferase [Saprospiraceae bacterium]